MINGITDSLYWQSRLGLLAHVHRDLAHQGGRPGLVDAIHLAELLQPDHDAPDTRGSGFSFVDGP